MAHAAAESPRESCGLVVNGIYLPRKNVAEKPEEDFRISSQGYAAALVRGELQALIHSHPGGPACPSEKDMANQMASGVPWGIVIPGKELFWFGDQCPIPRLRGRVFRHGVTDCYAVIRDWYRLVKKITLLDMPRRDKWWQHGQDIYMANFARAGFERVEMSEIARGDVLLGRIGFGVTVNNHAALYLGNGLILHHLLNRLSVREPVARWKKVFVVALRYVK
jgi:proteasome lid subunit RPN8/RPN11